jgi:HEAT repeat protein
LAALGELELVTDEPPLDVLAPVLNDPDPEIRLQALQLIGESDDERANELARQALSDPDEDVRSEAEDILSLDSDDDGD